MRNRRNVDIWKWGCELFIDFQLQFESNCMHYGSREQHRARGEKSISTHFPIRNFHFCNTHKQASSSSQLKFDLNNWKLKIHFSTKFCCVWISYPSNNYIICIFTQTMSWLKRESYQSVFAHYLSIKRKISSISLVCLNKRHPWRWKIHLVECVYPYYEHMKIVNFPSTSVSSSLFSRISLNDDKQFTYSKTSYICSSVEWIFSSFFPPRHHVKVKKKRRREIWK